MSLPELHPISVMFNFDTLINDEWYASFAETAGKFGKGIACNSEEGYVISYYPGQHDDVLEALGSFAQSNQLSYFIFGQGEKPSGTDMTIYDENKSIKRACQGIGYQVQTGCNLPDYCGDDSPLTAGLSSATDSNSGSSDTSNSGSSDSSNSGSSDSSATTSASTSDVIPCSTVATDGNGKGINALGSGVSSVGASATAAQIEGASNWFGYNSSVTTTTYEPPSTTIVTVTSCSDHVCSEEVVTTGLTTVTGISTVYTTFCPLSSTTPLVPSTETSSSATVEPTKPEAASTSSNAESTQTSVSPGGETSSSTEELSPSSSEGIETLVTQSSSAEATSSYQLQSETANEGSANLYSFGSMVAAAALMLL